MFNYLDRQFAPLKSYESLQPDDNLDSWASTIFVNYPMSKGDEPRMRGYLSENDMSYPIGIPDFENSLDDSLVHPHHVDEYSIGSFF